MRVDGFRLTQFQRRRDRMTCHSEVRCERANICALDVIAATGAVGSGFISSPSRRPRVRNMRAAPLLFGYAVNQPMWGLAAKQVGPSSGRISEAARRDWAAPVIVASEALPPAPNSDPTLL